MKDNETSSLPRRPGDIIAGRFTLLRQQTYIPDIWIACELERGADEFLLWLPSDDFDLVDELKARGRLKSTPLLSDIHPIDSSFNIFEVENGPGLRSVDAALSKAGGQFSQSASVSLMLQLMLAVDDWLNTEPGPVELRVVASAIHRRGVFFDSDRVEPEGPGICLPYWMAPFGGRAPNSLRPDARAASIHDCTPPELVCGDSATAESAVYATAVLSVGLLLSHPLFVRSSDGRMSFESKMIGLSPTDKIELEAIVGAELTEFLARALDPDPSRRPNRFENVISGLTDVVFPKILEPDEKRCGVCAFHAGKNAMCPVCDTELAEKKPTFSRSRRVKLVGLTCSVCGSNLWMRSADWNRVRDRRVACSWCGRIIDCPSPDGAPMPDARQAWSSEEKLEKIRQVINRSNGCVVPGGNYRTVNGETAQLPGFIIEKYPVACQRLSQFLKDNPGLTKDTPPMTLLKWNTPVNRNVAAGGVPMQLSEAFADWVGARLPTVEEWERAAGGPKGLVFPWGNAPQPDGRIASGSGRNGPYEATSDTLDRSVHSVLHMASNVLEWTATLDVLEGVRYHILKGGCFLDDKPYLYRNAARVWRSVAEPVDDTVGFRLVYNADWLTEWQE